MLYQKNLAALALNSAAANDYGDAELKWIEAFKCRARDLARSQSYDFWNYNARVVVC
jgi:hypothetical protein